MNVVNYQRHIVTTDLILTTSFLFLIASHDVLHLLNVTFPAQEQNMFLWNVAQCSARDEDGKSALRSH